MRDELSRLQPVLDAIYDRRDTDIWGDDTVPIELLRTIGADMVSVLCIGPDQTIRDRRAWPVDPVADRSAFRRGFHAHMAPSCAFCAGGPRPRGRRGVLSLSDVYGSPMRHAPQPEAWYFHRIASARQAVSIPMGIEVGGRGLLVLSRSGPDFRPHERLALALLQPHVAFAHRDSMRRAHAMALTDRQREILALASSGYTNAQIAERLCLSTGTVRKHLDNVFERLGVSSRAAAVRVFVTGPAPEVSIP